MGRSSERVCEGVDIDGTRIGVPDGVLVVGGGFVGSHVARGFVRRGVATTVLTRRPVDAATSGRLRGASVVIADAIDRSAVRAELERREHVAWCAGGLLPAESNERKVDDIVAALPPLLTVLDLLKTRGNASLTLISSGGTIYGNPSVLPAPEHYLPAPLTSHGVTKVTAELYLSLHHDLDGIRTLALRCSNVYGEGQQPDRSQGLVATALARARRGEPIPVFGDGGAIRDYIHVDDVVDVVCTLGARRDAPRVVNVGTGQGTSVNELLDLVELVVGRALARETRPPRPGDVRAVVLDTTLLRSLMAFEPVPLAEGLSRTWAELTRASDLLTG